jgi:hypothetical protein
MGTSANQPSPRTPNWKLANAILGHPAASAERQSEEIWRAAAADRGERLAVELGSPLLAAASRIASEIASPAQAARAFETSILEAHASGLALDLGKRALVRAVAGGGGATRFAAELFAETAAYYVSRDLPSVVAAPGRVSSTSAAIALKDQVRSVAKEASAKVELRTDTAGWRGYVSGVISELQRRSNG